MTGNTFPKREYFFISALCSFSNFLSILQCHSDSEDPQELCRTAMQMKEMNFQTRAPSRQKLDLWAA